jgi:hypothetical protein
MPGAGGRSSAALQPLFRVFIPARVLAAARVFRPYGAATLMGFALLRELSLFAGDLPRVHPLLDLVAGPNERT